MGNVAIVFIDNTLNDNTLTKKSTIPLLIRVQLLPVTYGTNTTTNDSVENIVRIFIIKLIPPRLLVIIESKVGHGLRMNLDLSSYISHHLARYLHSSIMQSFAHILHHITQIHLFRHLHIYVHIYIYIYIYYVYIESLTTLTTAIITNLPIKTTYEKKIHLISFHNQS